MKMVPAKFATWALGVILPLSAVANFASESEWERNLLARGGLVVGILCLVIARYTRTRAEGIAPAPGVSHAS